MLKFCLVCVLILFFIYIPFTVKASVIIYPNTPEKVLDTSLNLKINGISVPLEYQNTHSLIVNNGRGIESLSIRFSQDSVTQVSLNPNFTVSGASFRTSGRELPVSINNNVINFNTPTPGIYRLYITGFNKIIYFFVDPSNLEVPSTYINVNSLGISSDPVNLQTTKIQSAIDGCNNCTLFFPAGVYRTGKLLIQKNDVTIYLDKGVLIKGPDRYSDLDPIDADRDQIIYIRNSNNIKFYGLGTIDANGDAYVKETGGAFVHNIDIEDSSNIVFKDLKILNSTSWAFNIRRTGNVLVDNFKCYSGKDCFDIDSSTNITLQNVFANSIDDSFAVKTRYPGYPTNNVLIQNCYATADTASALKIGTEVRAPITNVKYRLCDVDNIDRAVNISTSSDADSTITNSEYRYIRIFGGGKAFVMNGGTNNVEVQDIKLSNIFSEIWNYSEINGTTRMVIDGIKILAGSSASNEYYLFENTGGSSNNTINNAEIYWQNNKSRWKGLSSNDSIKYFNLKEYTGYASSWDLNYIYGDYNYDSKISLVEDVIPLIKYVFSSGLYTQSLDANQDSKVDVLDVFTLIKKIFI